MWKDRTCGNLLPKATRLAIGHFTRQATISKIPSWRQRNSKTSMRESWNIWYPKYQIYECKPTVLGWSCCWWCFFSQWEYLAWKWFEYKQDVEKEHRNPFNSFRFLIQGSQGWIHLQVCDLLLPFWNIVRRYQLHNSEIMEESFFPITWQADGYRTPYLQEYCKDIFVQS